MPTDLLLATHQARANRWKDAADLQAYLLLVPLIACICSIMLAVQYPVFACAIAILGAD